MITFPCAKINLGLNVTGKRADGYHDLETVFYPINLCDKLEINEVPDAGHCGCDCILEMDGIKIAGESKDNLVVKAYNLVKKEHPDGAYTIRMLNDMFNLGMQTTEMQGLASKLGADCAFFVNPVPSFATGIGEQLSPVNVNLTGYHIAIVKPPVMRSTKEAFAQITPQQPKTSCQDIVRMPIDTWKELLANDFEKSIACSHPEIGEIKRQLYKMGALYAAMSGSGSAVFGIFKHKPENLSMTFTKYFTATV